MNFLNLGIVVALATFAGVTARAPQKIVHGHETNIKEFPSTVVLQKLNGRLLCGGTLISKRHVLTAAHCFTSGSKPNGDLVTAPASGIRVIAGHDHLKDSNNLEHYLAKRIDIHPKWQGVTDTGNSGADLAIVTLAREIPENDFQKIAALPSAKTKPGSIVTALGWGLTHEDESGPPSEHLQSVIFKVLDYHFCKAHRDPFVPEDVICAETGNRDGSTCSGDSGGPLYNADREVIGVVSYSYGCTGAEASVFTEVFPFRSWIKEVQGH